MAPPNILNGIRKQCALFLSLREHRGKLYNADSVATQLSLAADVSNNAKITVDVASLVARAFADGKGAYEYATPYEDNNYQTHRKEYCILGATRYRLPHPDKTGRWITAIGCFRTIEEAATKARDDMDSDHDGLVTLDVGIDDETIDCLVNELELQSQPPRDRKGRKRKVPPSEAKRLAIQSQQTKLDEEEAEIEALKIKLALQISKAKQTRSALANCSRRRRATE